MSLPPNAPPVVFIATSAREFAVTFYQDVLGLRLMGQDGYAATFDMGNRTPLRLTDIENFRPSGHTVAGWHVPDIVATVDSLAAKGVQFKVYEGFDQDERGIWGGPESGVKIAWFEDPDGNLLSLTQIG